MTPDPAQPPALDLERDLPTTRRDVEALRRVRRLTPGESYLEFLRRFPAPSYEELRDRRGPVEEPFEL